MPMNRTKLRQGAVAVEFAFMAPVLLTVVFGLIQLTRIYDTQFLLESAAREGARFASMDREGVLGVGQDSNTKMIADVKKFLASAGIHEASIQVAILDHNDPTQTFCLDDPNNNLKLFDVVIQVPYSSVSYTPVSVDHDYNLVGSITFRNGKSTITQ